jgi:hypothetical protein
VNYRALQIEAITTSLVEPIAEALALNAPQGADLTDVLADVREHVFHHLSSISERNEMTQIIPAPREPKKPSVDMIGTYQLNEAVTKTNPMDGLTYEVPRGEYPVMGLVSTDGKRINAAATIFTAPNPQSGQLMDVVEKLRPVDVPAMVQRREIALETNRDNSLKFPLSMFTGDAPQKKQTQAKAPEPQEHRLKVARSA